MLRQIVLLVALLSIATVVHARPADTTKAEARRHYDAGLAHCTLREYPQAIDEFQAAYRILPDPVFLYNLAQSHRLSNNPEQAVYFYQTYLRMAPEAANRAEVEERIAALQKLLAEKRNTERPPDHALPPSDSKATSAQTTPPPPTATTSETTTTVQATQSPSSHTDHKPLYRRWWFWTITGVVVAGAAVGIGLGVGLQKSASFNANVGTFGPNAVTVRF